MLHAPANVIGLVFADRAGTMVPALKSLQVRQAINYAIDRPAITAALFGKYGQPTDEITGPGFPGYDPALEGLSGSDPAKAKQLLASAGYPNGLTITVGSTPSASIDLMSQAIAANLAAVGITLDIKSEPAASYGQHLLSGFYPAYTFDFGLGDYYSQGNNMYRYNATLNPFHSQDRIMNTLYEDGSRQSAQAAAVTWRKLAAVISSRAWFATVSLIHRFYYARATLDGVKWQGATASPDIVDIYPAPAK